MLWASRVAQGLASWQRVAAAGVFVDERSEFGRCLRADLAFGFAYPGLGGRS